LLALGGACLSLSTSFVGFSASPDRSQSAVVRSAGVDDSSSTVSKSDLVRRTVGLSAASLLGAWTQAAQSASAEEVQGLGGKVVDADNLEASVFVGRYTDPNHPGGFREIFLSDTKMGPYQLITVKGGMGVREPKSFELQGMAGPATDKSKSPTIIIDFSAKGGPRDFPGVWDKDGITFKDGNHWPKVQPKK